jgi:hypothetical protein
MPAGPTVFLSSEQIFSLALIYQMFGNNTVGALPYQVFGKHRFDLQIPT